jgi:hypothetical protein
MVYASANCACSLIGISQTDAMGEYRADVPSGLAILTVKPDFTWEYRIDGSNFARSGKWSPEPNDTTRSVYAITFVPFEFGFPTSPFDPQKPSIWPAQFFRDYRGKIQACIMIVDICFKHV